MKQQRYSRVEIQTFNYYFGGGLFIFPGSVTPCRPTSLYRLGGHFLHTHTRNACLGKV